MTDPGEQDQPTRKTFNGISEELVAHAEQIAVLYTQVEELTEKEERPKGVHLQRFRFERVAPEVAWAAQLELAAWVPWLVATFGLESEIPPCWPRHDGLSEELAGLYLGWIGAWSTDSDPAGPLVWHERLYRFRDRPRAWGHGVNCTETSCGLSVEMAWDRTRRWLAGSQLPYDGQHADGFRFRRATAGLPAPTPPAAPKPATPAASGTGNRNGKAAAATTAAGSN